MNLEDGFDLYAIATKFALRVNLESAMTEDGNGCSDFDGRSLSWIVVVGGERHQKSLLTVLKFRFSESPRTKECVPRACFACDNNLGRDIVSTYGKGKDNFCVASSTGIIVFHKNLRNSCCKSFE